MPSLPAYSSHIKREYTDRMGRSITLLEARVAMGETYTDLDDLWCEWGIATSAIINHIKSNEPIGSEYGWNFEEGRVINQHGDGYSVYMAHTAYDPSVNSIVRLHVQAFVSPNDEITVKTNKREHI